MSNKLVLGLRDLLYKDKMPHLQVGNSAFADWFQAHPRACETGIKQMAVDAYAAGMGDPLAYATAYNQGLEEGIRRYAHWRDGVQYVGTTGKTLEQALKDVVE